MRIKSLTAAMALALTVAACATTQKLDAASDVHSLLVAIRDGDRATFDAHVDRPALRRQIEAELMARTGKDPEVRGWAALLAPALAKVAGDALVQPEVFRLVAERYGYKPGDRIPPALMISRALKPLPDGRVCAVRKKDGPCFLIFTKQDGAWRLSGFQGDLSELRLKG